MKAEDEDLKDEMLSKAINDGFKEDGISSNFTHQVMGKIEVVKKHSKPLVAWWAWLIIAGSFVTAVVLAFIYVPLPKKPVVETNLNLAETIEKINKYGFQLKAVMLVLAVIFVDQILKFRKKSTN